VCHDREADCGPFQFVKISLAAMAHFRPHKVRYGGPSDAALIGRHRMFNALSLKVTSDMESDELIALPVE
jgi:hypothetical protein